MQSNEVRGDETLSDVPSSSHGPLPRTSSGPSSYSHDISSHSTRSSLVATVIIGLTDSWTNESFASEVCSKVTGDTMAFSTSSLTSLRFLLPDCIFAFGSIKSFGVTNLILQGNSTFPDPFDRLATALNASEVFGISFMHSSFVPFTQSSPSLYAPNWNNLFARYPIMRSLGIQNCSIGGSLPSSLPSALMTLALSDNSLDGTIPSTLFINYADIVSAAPKTFICFLNRNRLTGSIPATLLASLPSQSGLSLDLSSNQLTGTIPSTLLNISQSATTLLFKAESNPFPAQAIPNDLWGLPASMPSLNYLGIYLSKTNLSGTIPSTWIAGYSFSILDSLVLRFLDCKISGGLPSGLFPGYAPMLSGYNLGLSNNPLNGPIASDFFTKPLMSGLGDKASVAALYSLELINCGLTGALTLPSISLAKYPTLYLSLSSNSLETLTLGAGASKYVQMLNVAGNVAMKGSIEALFSSTSIMTTLSAGNTMLSGTMPYMALMNTSLLQILMLDGVTIDFCGGGANRTAWTSTSLASCSLLKTSAFGCKHLYPAQCLTSAPPPSTTIPVAVSCLESTKPSDLFDCVDGIWVSNTSITTPVLTIPSGASETVIIGDLESSSIVFTGLGSTLTIQGCALNLTSVTLTLTPDDLKGSSKIVQQLIIFANSNCSNDNLDSIAIDSRVSGSTCRKVKTSKSISNGQLSAVFSIDSSGCNRWWIVLVSVIGGVVVLGVVIFVLLVILVPSVRYAVRPFSRPKRSDNL